MGKATFNIRTGIHVVPGIGKVDCNKKLESAEAIQLYMNPAFSSFITLQEAGVAVLKKKKLTEKEVAQLIQRANTVNEVDFLLKVKSGKLLEKLAETKKSALIK